MFLYHTNSFTYFDLAADTIIGRTSGDIIIPDQGLSGQHIKIHVDKSGEAPLFFIEDLGSKNRTALNRTEIIPFEKVRLFKDSYIEMGNQGFIATESDKLTIEEINELVGRQQQKQLMKAEGVKLVRDMKEKLAAEIAKLNSLQEENRQEIANRQKAIAEEEVNIANLNLEKEKEFQRLEREKEMIAMKTNAEITAINAHIQSVLSSIEEIKKKNAELAEELEKKLKRVRTAEKSPSTY